MTREEVIAYGKRVIDLGLNDETQAFCELAIKALEQEPCEDAVSRKAVRDTIFAECAGTKLDIDFAKVLLLQRAIKALPPVTPQEQSKPMVEIDLYSVIKQKYVEREVLDKIRAEIKAMSGDIETIADVLAIIDKYRESEDE